MSDKMDEKAEALYTRYDMEADAIEAIAQALRQARTDALEEAAKIGDEWDHGDHLGEDFEACCGNKISTKIRELKTRGVK